MAIYSLPFSDLTFAAAAAFVRSFLTVVGCYFLMVVLECGGLLLLHERNIHTCFYCKVT